MYYRGGDQTCQFTGFIDLDRDDDPFFLFKNVFIEALLPAQHQIASAQVFLARR